MLIFYSLAVLVGVLMALQGGLNSDLSRVIGSDVWATTICFVVGLTVLLLGILLVQQPLPAKKLLAAPWYVWTGGLVGACIVLSFVYLFAKIGAVNIVIFSIFGQMLCSLLIDHFGWFGVPISTVNWQRVAALSLMLLAVVWFQKSSA